MKMYEYQYFKTSKLWVLGSNPNSITRKGSKFFASLSFLYNFINSLPIPSTKISYSSLAVSRSITGRGKGEGYISPSSSVFLQRKNIGEVARSDGGVNLIEGAESTGGGVKSRPSFVYRK